MLSAFVFGLVASSALVIGAVAGAHWTPPRPLLASALALASGALITALAFDLFQESFNRGGAWLSSIGLLLGAAAFVVADEALDRYIEAAGGVSAFALLAAVTLDGIPENIALGVSLLEMSGGGTLTLLVAIFLSNLPESLGGPWGCASRVAPDASLSESGASPRSYSPPRWSARSGFASAYQHFS